MGITLEIKEERYWQSSENEGCVLYELWYLITSAVGEDKENNDCGFFYFLLNMLRLNLK